MENKATLRTLFNNKRKNLSQEYLDKASKEIALQIVNVVDFALINRIHIFLTATNKKEINTQYLIQYIWDNYPHIELCTSVVKAEENILAHYLFDANTKFALSKWQIPEPLDAAPITPQEIDVVIVPLLVFDCAGNRVGYGKGYYDRFLAECRADCVRVGVSMFAPVERIDDVAPHDVRLHYCLTPERVWRFEV